MSLRSAFSPMSDLAATLVTDDSVFHDLVDAVTDYAIFLLDARGHIASWNPGAEHLKGYTPSEALGRHFSMFYPEAQRVAGRPERILETVRSKGHFAEEGWRVRKNGSQFWASVTITPVRDARGQILGFAKVTRDLTERRAAEEELRRSEERFRLLVESVSDYAIYMLDAGGHITTWNSGAQRMTGYLASEALGQHFSIFFPPEDRAIKPAEEVARARTEGRFEDEGWRVRQDGTRFWANVVLTPMRDAHGQLLGFAKVTRDLTARREAEQLEQATREAEAAARRAEEANRVKDEFLATVSHELRTPLNAILGWATVLRTKAAGSPLSAGLEAICRNAEAQARIVEDILDVSRIISGKLKLSVRPVDLAAVVAEALDVVEASAKAKQIRIDVRHYDPSARLVGDPERLRQVVWNLLSNAVKFTPQGGHVEVSIARSEDGNLVLSVRDTGRGIEEAFLPYVFDRFRQADSSSTRRHGGLGLGLALVRHIVELHGGRVYVESPGVNLGATFRVHLPVRALSTEEEEGSGEPRNARPNPERVPLNGIQVLVVDDDLDSREVLAELLSDDGAVVRVAGSVPEALEAFQRARPAVIISDIAMPNEDGYSLARRIRALEAGGEPTAMVALSAFTRAQDRAATTSAGFTAHLSKPVVVGELTRLIASLVRRS